MKLGVFMVLFGGRKLEDALDYVVSKGLKAVEIGMEAILATATATLKCCWRMKQPYKNSNMLWNLADLQSVL